MIAVLFCNGQMIPVVSVGVKPMQHWLHRFFFLLYILFNGYGKKTCDSETDL